MPPVHSARVAPVHPEREIRMKKRLLSLLMACTMMLGTVPAALAAGEQTYTVTANLIVPGELNTQLPGVTAYVSNPNNPLGIVPEGYDSVEAKAPTEPVSNNAKLTVAADGTMTLQMDTPNPVFTLQKIGSCSNADILAAPRDSQVYSNGAGSASRNGRITSLTIKLKDRSGTYVFSDCVEFPTLLGVDWTVPLTLKVDLSGVADTAAKSAFADVSSDAYYAQPVQWAVENKVTSGTSATTFSPNDKCTRAQIITFLWRASGSPAVSGENPFTDVSDNVYYYQAVLWAAENGMASGTAFSPNEPCTRAMAVEFMWKQAGSPKAEAASFTDVPADASYSDAVGWAVQHAVTSGTSATTFSPDSTCTRGQIVTFLYRGLAG